MLVCMHGCNCMILPLSVAVNARMDHTRAARRRAGASKIVAAERVRHLCEAAELAVAHCCSASASNLQVVHKDGRFLSVARADRPAEAADGANSDLEREMDVIAFEVG